MRIEGTYYAVDNGVWFSSASPQGPWIVADTIPTDKIAGIPPSSPVYNTTYVTVYDSTPEVFYVGYTPGYLWSFPYYGVPVYGTGWYYPPYIGVHYYPRAPSWGGPFLRVGAVLGCGYHNGYYPGRCCGGRYGGGYRHNDININTGDINIGNNINVGSRDKIENNFSKKQRKNDLYTDRSGQVARRDADQWPVRKDKQWSNVAKAKTPTRDVARMPETSDIQSRVPAQRPQTSHRSQFDHSAMTRDFNARQRGGGGMNRRRR